MSVATIETALGHFEQSAKSFFLGLAHLAVTLTPTATAVADTVETATGNVALVPVTNAVSAVVESTGTAVQNASKTSS